MISRTSVVFPVPRSPSMVTRAGGELRRARVAVVGRPALEHVGDEHLLAREPNGGEQLLQQLAGLAYEGSALLVLVVPRRLAHEHEVAGGVAFSGHGLCAGGVQLAEGARLDLRAEGGERGEVVVSGRCHRRSWRRRSSSW